MRSVEPHKSEYAAGAVRDATTQLSRVNVNGDLPLPTWQDTCDPGRRDRENCDSLSRRIAGEASSVGFGAYLNALIKASNCAAIDLSCGVTGGTFRSSPSSS